MKNVIFSNSGLCSVKLSLAFANFRFHFNLNKIEIRKKKLNLARFGTKVHYQASRGQASRAQVYSVYLVPL